MKVLRCQARRELFSNYTLRCSIMWTTDWQNVIRKIKTNTTTEEWNPPTVGLVIKQNKLKKKEKKNLDKNGGKNKPKNYRRITNLKTRCADQSDLVPFISHFRWSQTLDIFLFFFFFPFFLLSSSFLSLVRGAATPGNLFYKAVECLTRDNEVNQRLAFKKKS